MIDLVYGYGDAAFESARRDQHLEEVREDLVGFAAALVLHEELRRALSEGAVDLVTRRSIVAELLSGRSEEANAMIAFALRVVRPAEIGPCVTELASLAEDRLLAVPNDNVEGQMAKRSGTRDRVRGYAERVLQELGHTSDVDEVEDELFRLSRAVDDNINLRRVLADTNLSLEGRSELLADLLSAAKPATLRLATYVLHAGRVRDLVGTYEWLVELCAEERGRRVAEVRTAVALADEEVARLSRALSVIVGRPVEIRIVIDPDTVAGVLIAVGDLVIDGTIRSRFERLRDVFAH